MRRGFVFWSHLKGEWFVLAGAVLLVMFGLGVSREIARRRSLDAELASLQAEVETLTRRRGELQTLIAEFQRPAAQEAEARQKLNLARPGERVLIIDRQPVASTAPEDTSAPTTTPPVRWWRYFFGSS